MGTVAIIAKVVLCVVSLIIIALVMLQKPKDNAGNAVMGGSGGSYMDKMKSHSGEARLSFLTKVFTGVFIVVLVVLMFI